MSKIKVLFVCVHNSARSVMAEALLNNLYGDKFYAESAGLEPGILNQNVVKVMNEKNIDISQKRPQSVFELFKIGRKYHYIITVCDEANAEKCPIFPGVTKTIHWSFEDPSKYKCEDFDNKEILEKTCAIRNKIEQQITEWVNSLNLEKNID